MKKTFLVKICVISIFSLSIFVFLASCKSEIPATVFIDYSIKISDATGEIKGYKNWTKVNQEPQMVESRLAMLCARPTRDQLDTDAKNPHNDKFITVYVNDIGKSEMMTKKQPHFPIGTVIVKEKLTTAESRDPELLTVMIKRAKDYNPELGDWEFLTFNGAGTETTARGKLDNCQACHLAEQRTDYISRRYLPDESRQKLK